jgi:CRISPR-associated protein Csm2
MVTIKPEWIKNGANEEMVSFAEDCGKKLVAGNLTNSKIRSIYGEIKRIQGAKDFEKSKTSFYLLKPKVAYAQGREPKNNGLILFKEIFDGAFKLVTDDKTYENFCNLMEAILAYHRAFGGK